MDGELETPPNALTHINNNPGSPIAAILTKLMKMSSRLIEANQSFGHNERRAHGFFRDQDDEPVIALLDGWKEKRLGAFRDEDLAAGEANGATARERASVAISGGMGPAALVAVGIGALVGGPVGAAVGAGVVAVTGIGGAAVVATHVVNSRGWGTDLKNLADNWEFAFDNDLAQQLKKDLPAECRPETSLETPFRVCDDCEDILLGNHLVNQRLGYLDRPNGGCWLCRLVVKICKESGNFNRSTYSFITRVGSTIVLQTDSIKVHNTPVLRLFSDMWSSGKSSSRVQIGFPVLPQSNEFRFTLIRRWIKWCDKKHSCNNLHGKDMPSRLIDVGTSLADTPRLVSGKGMTQSKYIALSHRWGLTPGERAQYCTTKDNFEAQHTAINCLAPNFRDAVEVARAVGVRYLWIDSLCIIQGDPEDWEEQAKLMERVYASAYFTIAATSAEDMNGSFLKQTERRDEHICFKNNKNQVFYASRNLTSFDEEVDRAELNDRAWTLQERLLSCRTIHFAAGQMYWECGHGVYCEDLTRLKTSEGQKKSFRLDSEFPRLLRRSGVGYTLHFIQYLLEDYSKRGISMPEDRAVAIAGLESRITTALSCESRCGIFGTYLHRNLLWRRSGGQSSERINYTNRKVPSWSWMAYEGGIEFLDIPYGKFMFFAPVEFDPADETALIVQLWAFKNDSVAQGVTSTSGERQIIDAKGEEAGSISYDAKDREDPHRPLCVIIGRANVPIDAAQEEIRYHILIAKKSQEAEGTYERIGVGWVRKDYVLSRVKSRARLV